MKTLIENLKLWILKNWNTTVVGVIIMAILGYALAKGWITVDSKEFIISILTALGFVFSKDGNKTGV